MGARRGPRAGGNPKHIFNGLVISYTSFTGDGWNEANVSRWVSLRKGRLSWELDNSVTHLVCSEADVKNKHPKVREAQKRGVRNCKLVTQDWLEDSMHTNSRLHEEHFSPCKAILKAKKEAARKKQILKGIEQGEKTVNTNLYHHYYDATNFQYVVTLGRDDTTHGALGERYVLFLEESNAKPHLYWFFAKYYKSKGNTFARVYRPSAAPGSFQREFDNFKTFFQIKTNISWEERLVKEGTTEKKYFQYKSPVGGKPVGWVPRGLEKPEHPPLPEQGQLQSQQEQEQQPQQQPEGGVGVWVVNLPLRPKSQPPQNQEQQTDRLGPEQQWLQEQQMEMEMETEMEVDGYLPSEDHESIEAAWEIGQETDLEPKTGGEISPPHGLESKISPRIPFQPESQGPKDEHVQGPQNQLQDQYQNQDQDQESRLHPSLVTLQTPGYSKPSVPSHLFSSTTPGITTTPLLSTSILSSTNRKNKTSTANNSIKTPSPGGPLNGKRIKLIMNRHKSSTSHRSSSSSNPGHGPNSESGFGSDSNASAMGMEMEMEMKTFIDLTLEDEEGL